MITGRTQKVQKTQLKVPLLSEILNKYAEDSITDEQVQRVLKPVLIMIHEGKFDRSPFQRFSWLTTQLLSIATAMVMIIAAALSRV